MSDNGGNPAFSRTTIIIPTKNEAATIGDIIDEVKGYGAQIIVSDGWSTDGTQAIATAAGALVVPDNRLGKGDAIRCAIPHIRGEYAVFIDADGSHDATDIPSLLAPLIADESDHVTASRLLGGSSELHGGFDEFLRLTGSSLITAFINWRFKVRISDSQNGFRALRTSVLQALDLRENITTIEQEMIIETIRLGYRLTEVPSHEAKRRAGESKLHVGKVWFQYGRCLARKLLVRGV